MNYMAAGGVTINTLCSPCSLWLATSHKHAQTECTHSRRRLILNHFFASSRLCVGVVHLRNSSKRKMILHIVKFSIIKRPGVMPLSAYLTFLYGRRIRFTADPPDFFVGLLVALPARCKLMLADDQVCPVLESLLVLRLLVILIEELIGTLERRGCCDLSSGRFLCYRH